MAASAGFSAAGAAASAGFPQLALWPEHLLALQLVLRQVLALAFGGLTGSGMPIGCLPDVFVPVIGLDLVEFFIHRLWNATAEIVFCVFVAVAGDLEVVGVFERLGWAGLQCTCRRRGSIRPAFCMR